MARSLDLGDRTHFVGQVPMHEVPGYITGFDIGYVAPTPVEELGMYFSPLKLLEYLAMERPALAADYPGLIADVDVGETGFLFSPGNIESLKGAIRESKAAADRLREMGRRGRQVVLARHTWRARVQELIANIHSVLAA
jgi:glycosyltransferase involved in cell wall biosynthesis